MHTPIVYVPKAFGGALDEFMPSLIEELGEASTSHHSLFGLPFMLYGRSVTPTTPGMESALLWVSLNEFLLLNQQCLTIERFNDNASTAGWRSEDEATFNQEAPVALVCVGGMLQVTFRNNADESEEALVMQSGSFLIMEPGMQATHSYSVESVTDKETLLLTMRAQHSPT